MSVVIMHGFVVTEGVTEHGGRGSVWIGFCMLNISVTELVLWSPKLIKIELCGLTLRASCFDQVTSACRRS
jgi:hypothetical protein